MGPAAVALLPYRDFVYQLAKVAPAASVLARRGRTGNRRRSGSCTGRDV